MIAKCLESIYIKISFLLQKKKAKNAFENMKKNYSKKKGNLKSAQSQSGNNREPVD